MRSLFTKSLKNVAGKLRTERRWAPVAVPEGIEQVSPALATSAAFRILANSQKNFVQFGCVGPKDEADKRFNYFTTQVRFRLG